MKKTTKRHHSGSKSLSGKFKPFSAVAKLGGKVSVQTVRVPITNVYMEGDYTGVVYIGSQKKAANVILDTGSSTFAVDGTFYNPQKDTTAKITDMAQEVEYVDGSNWVGAVVLTDVAMGNGSQAVSLPQVNVAVAYHATASMFAGSNGILGLAYTGLNEAFIMPGPTIPARYTYNQIQSGHMTHVEPYFTQLEQAGVVANKFAFYTLRSMINLATSAPSADPLNNGFLILGGGEESTDLYTGSFQSARVVDDQYYNTNLKSVTVGNGSPIAVSPTTKASGQTSNSVIDSGTNSLVLDQTLFNKIVEELSSSASEELATALQAGYVSMKNLDLTAWPTLTFVLEGALGTDVELTVTPENYWQTNAPKRGYATAVISGDGGQGGGQSILGLPLMNNYFTIFDRSVDKGLGAVSFARIKSPAS